MTTIINEQIKDLLIGSEDRTDIVRFFETTGLPRSTVVRILKAPWKPFRSAPKDGTAVLMLLEGSDIPHPVRFMGGVWDNSLVAPHDLGKWMNIPDDRRR